MRSESDEAGRRSPYLGLSPYDEADAELFFGRRAERDLVEHPLEDYVEALGRHSGADTAEATA